MGVKAIQGVGENRLVVLREDPDELWICNFAHWGDRNKKKMWSKLELPWSDEPEVDEHAMMEYYAEKMRQEFKDEKRAERSVRKAASSGEREQRIRELQQPCQGD